MLITMPSDLGAELSDAARWYADEPEMQTFLEHVRAGHSWSERRPLGLLGMPFRSSGRRAF
jgi:hypothetical protein